MSVEVFEDTGIETPDGERVAEQAKSALAHNPIADRAIDFWKTLANWTAGAQSGLFAVASTRFVLYVSPPHRPGRIVRALALARDGTAARAALAEARSEIWAKKTARKVSTSTSLRPQLDVVFSAPESLVLEIISRFELEQGERDATREIESRIRQKFVSEQQVPTVAKQAIGWVKARIDRLILEGKPALVSVDDFQSEMTAFAIKVDRSLILNSFAPTPPAEAIQAELLPQRCYIRQLDFIGADHAQKLRAANDYLRAAYDRSEWATRGIVHRSSIQEFQDQLVRIWESKRQISVLEMEGRLEELVGKHLFASCSSVSASIQGLSAPAHFTSGCYHSLSDAAVIGWHPRYKELLSPPPSTKEP